MKKLLLISLLLLLSTLRSFAQDQETIIFPPDQNGYYSQIENYIQRVPDKKRKQILLDLTNWVNLYQPEENEWIELAELSNVLVSKGMNITPQFTGFLEAVISFKDRKLGNQAFISCLSFIRQAISTDSENIVFAEKILDFMKGYNDNNELFNSGAIAWTMNSSEILLDVDSSLFVSFASGRLLGVAGREQSQIDCSGAKYYPLSNELLIDQGTTNWEDLGLSESLVYAQMQDFSIDLSKSVYSVDSARLFDKRYFDHPISGQLEIKIATGLPKERRGYPKFTSYNTMNQIKDLYPGIDYQGGYSLQGRKIVGANIQNKKGLLNLNYRSLPKLQVASDYFVFTDDRAVGVNAGISIYLGTDSIFHPGLSFRYNNKTLETTMIRDGQGLSNSRFFDSYHELDLDIQMISWFLNDSLMTLAAIFGSLESKADFESSDFYSIERFNQVQVADLVNPLIALKNCSKYYGSKYFTSGDLSSFMDRPHHLIEEMLLNLSFLGFVRYSTDDKLVEVTKRCFDFIDKHAERQDYDMIQFRSDQTPPKPNGILNLNTGQLQLFGVESIQFSRMREVSAYPKGNTIKVDKNRGISFDGYIKSGLLGFTGSGFKLNYDSFELKLDSIEHIQLKVHLPINGNYENTELADITSIIENTSGSLFIDHPENKSGMKAEELIDYPMFIADTAAYVYYDQDFIQNGAYKRDSFYFSTNNLVIKGHNSKFLKDSLSFNGQFVTAGIFPEINVDLGYQIDHSLGFDTLFTPESGYPVYQQRGTFYNQINMNAEGLLGNGVLNYLGATMRSEHFLFLPDEVRSRVTKIEIEQDMVEAGSPKASGNEVNISWKPTEDKMIAHQEDGLMNLYEGVVFDGNVFIEPDGLKGKGIMQISGFEIKSDDFNFFQNSFQANSSDFSIQEDFRVKESMVHVDFRDSLVHIEAESESSLASYPDLKFDSRFKTIDWRIGNAIIDVNEPTMISADIGQKGLTIDGQKARFDMNNIQLNLDGIEFIDIADVRIFPGKQSTTIRMNAFVDSLPGSTIVPLDSSLHHTINNATVFLRSSENYRASGEYQYVDRAGREFTVDMNNITVNSSLNTVAQGRIEMTDNFFLSPEYAFMGTASLSMNKKPLTFDGHFQLTHDCLSTTKKWISLNSEIFPDSLILPFDSLSKDINGDKAYAGFFLSNQPVEFYSSFMGPHTRYSDQAALEVSGYVQFNDETGEYRLASMEKLKDPGLIESEIKLDRQNCQVIAEGTISPGLDLGQIDLKSAGKIIHDLATDSVNLKTVTSLDFFMNDRALDFMAKELNKITGAQAVNYSDQQFRRSLQFYLGPERATEILNELSLRGSFRKLPDDFNHTVLFSHLDLKWNEDKGSFQSVGKIGISNILDTPVNKLFEGKVEFAHRRGGGSFTMYLEPEPGSYFFFYYSRGLMQVLAGPKYEKFNTFVQDTKESKRKQEILSGADYQYYLGQYRLVRSFLDQFNEQ